MIFEIWKDVLGYEGKYQVSNIGRVKSIPRIRKGNRNAVWITKEKILSFSQHNCGYRHVTLFMNGQRTTIFIHILVASAFHCNPDNKPQVNHINGIKSDNRVENVEWSTSSENGKHAYRMGLQKARKGVNNEQCKLTFEQVGMIREEYASGSATQKDIALKYGVSDSRICNIVNFKARVTV